ncbi:MAG: GAF domain-containing protein, partial [Armatimonadota bacterium]
MDPIMQQMGALQTDELSVLREFSQALAGALDCDELLALVPPALHRLVPCDISALAVSTDTVPRVLLRDARPVGEPIREQARLLVCSAFHRLTGIPPADARIDHGRASGEASQQDASGDIQSICDVPLSTTEGVVGAVSVLSLQKEGFDEHAVSLVRTLASQTAAAVARIR